MVGGFLAGLDKNRVLSIAWRSRPREGGRARAQRAVGHPKIWSTRSFAGAPSVSRASRASKVFGLGFDGLQPTEWQVRRLEVSTTAPRSWRWVLSQTGIYKRGAYGNLFQKPLQCHYSLFCSMVTTTSF